MPTYQLMLPFSQRLTYLDQAATSFPKPPQVIDAVTRCIKHSGGNPGRSSHHLALAAAEEIFACREIAASMFDTSPDRVIFTGNTTQAINMAIKGLLSSCHHETPHVLCSDIEHNAVYRPLWKLQKQGKITLDIFDTLTLSPHPTTEAILSAIKRKIRPETTLLVCTHASNICSATLPIQEIGVLCHEHNIHFVVDGAQSAGCHPIRVKDWHIDALCLPGHKGLLGPMGVGMLLLGPNATLDTILEGGNGVDSLLGGMGDDLPERLEAGTLPTPCIAGLGAGMAYINQIGLDTIAQHEKALGQYVTDALMEMSHVQVYVPHHVGNIVLFSVNGITSEDAGRLLDAKGICLRPGFHCSALGHLTLKTPIHGALRASFGYLNTQKDAQALVSAVRELGTKII